MLNQGEKQIIVFHQRFFSMKRKIQRLEKVYDRNFLPILSVVERKYYAAMVRRGAFNARFQFDEPNNWETTEKKTDWTKFIIIE